MRLPGFNAEVSLKPTVQKYRAQSSSSSPRNRLIFPQWSCQYYGYPYYQTYCFCGPGGIYSQDCQWMFRSGVCVPGTWQCQQYCSCRAIGVA